MEQPHMDWHYCNTGNSRTLICDCSRPASSNPTWICNNGDPQDTLRRAVPQYNHTTIPRHFHPDIEASIALLRTCCKRCWP